MGLVQVLGFFDHLPVPSRLLRELLMKYQYRMDNEISDDSTYYLLILRPSPLLCPGQWGPCKPMGPPYPASSRGHRQFCGDDGYCDTMLSAAASARLICGQPSIGSSLTGFSIPFQLLSGFWLRSSSLERCQWIGFLKPF